MAAYIEKRNIHLSSIVELDNAYEVSGRPRSRLPPQIFFMRGSGETGGLQSWL